MTNENHADRVEEALSSFRDRPVPAGPPDDLIAGTMERLRSMNSAADLPQTLNKNRLSRFARSRAAIVAGALLIAIVAWVGLAGLPGTIAFADVQQQLERVRTVRYVETRLVTLADNELEMLRSMARNWNQPVPNQPDLSLGDAHQPQIISIRGPHRQRTEVLNANGQIKSIHIQDLQAGKHVMLLPEQRKFLEFTASVTIDLDSGNTSETAIKPAAPEVDLIANIREIPADATTRLPERTIAGKQVVGFYSRKTLPKGAGTDTWERTCWVDPGTKLPVRIEVSHYSTDARVGRSDWVLSGFVFDEDIPESEFSTDMPQGYARETQKVYGIKAD